MPKRTPSGDVYYYYALTPLMPPRDRRMVSRALELLRDHTLNIFGQAVPGDMIPYNVIAVRPSSNRVSFMWYTGFWSSDRPLRVYSVSVNLETSKISYRVEKRFEPAVLARSTYNYLHHKESFVHGVEALAINPYRNCKTLERRLSEARDEWVELPWVPVVICARNLDEFLEVLSKLHSRVNPNTIKIVAYVGKICDDPFTRSLVSNSCIETTDSTKA